MGFFCAASNVSMSFLANTALATVAGGVAACAAGLTAVYIVTYAEETPAVITVQCALGIERADCPRYGEDMARLKGELEDIAAERSRIESQLAGLRAVETAVDEITLFESRHDPKSGLKITVGTVYKEFVNDQPAPDSYFCYINLRDGAAGESRNLYFYGHSGPYNVSETTLRQAGVDPDTLSFGRSVCTPFLIGGK